MDTLLSSRQAAHCRRYAGAERCPVEVVAGDSPPRAAGERGYSVFRGSETRVNFPASARYHGHKLDWVASTYRVEVGRLWLLADQLPRLLRDLPASVLRWNDGTVRRIAGGIQAGRARDLLPVLADALLDAGCGDEELMALCREDAR